MKTLVIGASTNPERYSYMAAEKLLKYNHEVNLFAKKPGILFTIPIQTDFTTFNNIHTITLYVGSNNQDELILPIINLKPKRVIFNPGTENMAFSALLATYNIEAIDACTLVLLGIGAY